jgi:hypothetical protein
MNLLAFNDRFPDEAACENHLIALRWPEGFVCPDCSAKDSFYIKVRRCFECRQCGRQQTITADTMFHKSRTPLREWFLAIYLVCESKKGISGLGLAHHLGMKDERRAYRLKSRIRQAMAERNSYYLLEGFVELDEAFFGGVTSGKGRGAVGKTPVLVGVSVNEHDKPEYVRLQVIENLKAATVLNETAAVISPEAIVVSDAHPSHRHLKSLVREHIACTMDRPSLNQEILPWVHIVISNAKRFILGTHHAVQNLQGYLKEFTWRFNRRFCNLFDRMLITAVSYKPRYLLA